MDHGRDAVNPWDIDKGPLPFDTNGQLSDHLRQHFASLHLAWQLMREEVDTKEAKQRAKHNKRYQTNVTFTVNQRVLIRQAGRKSKMHMPYVGPFKIEAVLGRDRYRVRGRRNAKRDHHEFHVSRLKLWPESADDEKVYLDDLYFDVDRIVDHRRRSRNGHPPQFRQSWLPRSSGDME
jgi:hypothetical protein